jgi:undecaprenyl-diphosphatase
VDLEIVQFCNQLGRGIIDPASRVVCEIWFLALVWATLAGFAMYFDRVRGREVLGALLVGLALHFVFTEAVLKHALLEVTTIRLRPYVAHPDVIVPIGTLFADSSFPSSHNATTAAVAMVFSSFYRRTWPFALAFVMVIAFARMHNGMHYPTDVATGIALGVGYGLAARYIINRLKERRQRRAQQRQAEPQG